MCPGGPAKPIAARAGIAESDPHEAKAVIGLGLGGVGQEDTTGPEEKYEQASRHSNGVLRIAYCVTKAPLRNTQYVLRHIIDTIQQQLLGLAVAGGPFQRLQHGAFGSGDVVGVVEAAG